MGDDISRTEVANRLNKLGIPCRKVFGGYNIEVDGQNEFVRTGNEMAAFMLGVVVGTTRMDAKIQSYCDSGVWPS